MLTPEQEANIEFYLRGREDEKRIQEKKRAKLRSFSCDEIADAVYAASGENRVRAIKGFRRLIELPLSECADFIDGAEERY